ncbi:MAG: hypothetical protein H6600_05730 [Flavobacteriales bacterium]|nr:hypothetical protein [Flavobacteriales bacterium]
MRYLFISILVLILNSSGIIGQTSNSENVAESYFIQFMMTNLETRDKAIQIDNFVRAQSGVTMSRADFNSKKYLIIFDSNSSITEEQVIEWITSFGIEIKCIRKGIHGVDSIIDQKMDCE